MLNNPRKYLANISPAIFYSMLFFVISARAVRYNLLDYDLFSRLIQGFSVVKYHHVFYNDIISYTKTHTWFDPEWLTSGLIYFVTEHFNGTGLVLLKAIFIFLMFLVIVLSVKLIKKTNESPYNMGFYVLLIYISAQASLFTFTTRCHFVTFIFAGIWICMLELIRRGNNKLLLFLPFIMVLWLNSHGGSLAGVGLLLLYGIGEALNKKPFKKYFIVLIFVCLAYFINPWGIDFIKFMIESAYLDRSWISEWQSPINRNIFSFVAFFVLSICCYIYRQLLSHKDFKSLDKTKALVLLVVAFLSLRHLKHIGLFVVIYSILLYDDYFYIYHFIMNKIKNRLHLNYKAIYIFNRIKNILLYLSIFIYCVYALTTVPSGYSYYKNSYISYPVKALEFLRINNIKGNIFAPFYFSSYIAYGGYPNLKIYMDGRQEQVYDSKTFDKEMFFLGKIGKNSINFLKQYPHDIILLEKKWGVNKYLSKSPDWVKIYSDKIFIIYVKKEFKKASYKGPNRNVIELMDNIFKDSVFMKDYKL